MTSVGTVLSYPIPLYANVPIESQFYQPSQFQISNVSLGATTTITTSVNHNYVIGQQVRILIPVLYGCQQLNGLNGIVLSIPAANQFIMNINSNGFDPFIATPLTSSITAITNASPCVITSVNPFLVGNRINISGVGGMTQLNGMQFQIFTCNATSITLSIDSIFFGVYTSGGTCTLITNDFRIPQCTSMGDVNTGIISSTGRNIPSTNIPGSFINIS